MTTKKENARYFTLSQSKNTCSLVHKSHRITENGHCMVFQGYFKPGSGYACMYKKRKRRPTPVHALIDCPDHPLIFPT